MFLFVLNILAWCVVAAVGVFLTLWITASIARAVASIASDVRAKGFFKSGAWAYPALFLMLGYAAWEFAHGRF